MQNEGDGEDADMLNDRAFDRPLPLTHYHMLYINEYLEDQETTFYNMPELFELKEDVDVTRLCAAMDRVFMSHPALLSKFVKINDSYQQVYDKDIFEPAKAEEISDEDFEKIKMTLSKPMDLIGGRLYRSRIFVTPSKKYLFIDMHHSIADGAALLLLKDQIYECFSDPDQELPKDYYYYFMSKLFEYKNSSNYKDAESYYSSRYMEDGGLDKCSCILKPDKEGPDIGNGVFLKGGFKRDAEGEGSLKYLAAMCLAVAEINGEDSALVYCIYNGRNELKKEQSVGLYARELPVFYRRKDGESKESILADVREQLDFGMAHCDYSFAEKHPLEKANTVLFNYQKNTMDIGKLGALIANKEELPRQADQKNGFFFCGMIDIEGAPELTFYISYSKGFYSEDFCRSLCECFEKKIGLFE